MTDEKVLENLEAVAPERLDVDAVTHVVEDLVCTGDADAERAPRRERCRAHENEHVHARVGERERADVLVELHADMRAAREATHAHSVHERRARDRPERRDSDIRDVRGITIELEADRGQVLAVTDPGSRDLVPLAVACDEITSHGRVARGDIDGRRRAGVGEDGARVAERGAGVSHRHRHVRRVTAESGEASERDEQNHQRVANVHLAPPSSASVP